MHLEKLHKWASRWRITSGGLWLFGALTLLTAFVGCGGGFPASPTTDQIALRNLIPPNTTNFFDMASDEDRNPEYVYRRYKVTLKVPPPEQKEMVSTIKVNFADAVKRLGAEIDGEGFSGDWERSVAYKGRATVGEFHLFAVPLGESKLRVMLIQFECLRR